MSQTAERKAWTEFVDGPASLADAPSISKYSNVRCEGYASKHEADVAAKLWALSRGGLIVNLQEQVSFTLVEGDGKLRPIRYVADFTYIDSDKTAHICDAKGYTKDKVYRLKKKMMKLMLGLEIEEL